MRNKFCFIWNTFLQIANAFNIFIVLVILGSKYNSRKGALSIIELIQILDILITYILEKAQSDLEFLRNLRKKAKNKIIRCFCYFPQVLLVHLLENYFQSFQLSEEIIINMLAVKLLGIFELFDFIEFYKKFLMETNINSLFFIKLAENILILVFSHHLFASLWLILNKYDEGNS